MPKREKRYKLKRKRTSLNASNAGPILAFSATVATILGAVALIVFIGLPALLPRLGIDYHPPWQPTPTPRPTARPTPTPHPAALADPVDLQHEVVLSGHAGYNWFADPYAWNDTLIFTAGHLVNSDVRMDLLFRYDIGTGEAQEIEALLQNQSYVYPMMNDRWLVYLDAKEKGGGTIRAKRMDTGELYEVKQVYADQPVLQLDGDTLAWIERTGTRMDKLFVCDLNTLENTAIRLFSGTAYGQSAVSMKNGQIVFADLASGATAETAEDQATSAIYSLTLSDESFSPYTPGTYVHDPLTNGKQWIWRNGSHGPGDDLYMTQNGTSAKLIAENIADYGISEHFAAYSRNEAIYVYFFDNGQTVQITPDTERERTQLLGVSDGVVIWMDVTSRERDIMKYAVIE
ncbi:MAG TPA: hypothetical protein VN366_01350 [Feifaniaceae bacterium]|nr:hypothetical protein [Feifaniaceae bacterium]